MPTCVAHSTKNENVSCTVEESGLTLISPCLYLPCIQDFFMQKNKWVGRLYYLVFGILYVTNII